MPALLTLGTGQLSGRTSASTARRVVDAALAAGVRRVDTARAYGEGETERLLGAALRARPDVEVITKVGLGPLERRRLAAVRWRALAPIAGLLPSGGREVASIGDEDTDDPVEVRLDERSVRTSIDLSRRALGRDRLDVVLLHELDAGPAAAQVADVMDALVQEGTIGAWGVGTRRPALRRLIATGARFGALVQTTGGPLLAPAPAPAPAPVGLPLSVHSVLGPGGGLLNAFLEWLPTSGLQPVWERSVGPLDARRTAGTALLRVAVSDPRTSAVLVSSRDPAGIERTVAAVRSGESTARLKLLEPLLAAFRERGSQ